MRSDRKLDSPSCCGCARPCGGRLVAFVLLELAFVLLGLLLYFRGALSLHSLTTAPPADLPGLRRAASACTPCTQPPQPLPCPATACSPCTQPLPCPASACPPCSQPPLPLPSAPRGPAASAGGGRPSNATLTARLAHIQRELKASRLGTADVRLVAPLLLRFADPAALEEGPLAVLDIGANTGDTSAALLSLFTSAECLRYLRVLPQVKDTFDPCTLTRIQVVSFEPLPANFGVLQERAAEAGWEAAGWSGVQAAVTSPAMAAAGTVRFFGDANKGNQQGSLAAKPANVHSSRDFTDVNATTVDAWLGNHSSPRVLLLKVDTEGFDAHVLRGAEGLLRARRAVCVVFEYNYKWRTGTEHDGINTLKETVGWMGGLGYACHFLTSSALVPLSGEHWHDAFEIFEWSNVMCMPAGDPRLAALRRFFNYNETGI